MLMFSRQVFMLFSGQTQLPIGTAFAVHQPHILLTADHVVSRDSDVLPIVLDTSHSPVRYPQVRRIARHPKADVAALLLEEDGPSCFDIPQPHVFYLGDEIASYGFPMVGSEKPIPARFAKGHIQRIFNYREDVYDYLAYELGFPAFPGHSGSPVFLDTLRANNRNLAVGVVTNSVSYSSTQGDEVTASASWALGAALLPLKDWLQSL